MHAASGRDFIEDAFIVGVPSAAVFKKCRIWGVPRDRAAEIANESASEAYGRAIERVFSNSDHFRAWVTRTAVNLAIDRLRRDARTVSLNESFEPRQPFQAAELDNDLYSRALESLSEQDRMILRWTYQESLTLDEMARRLFPDSDTSKNAQRLRIKRQRDAAIEKIRVFLSQNSPCRPAPNDAT